MADDFYMENPTTEQLDYSLKTKQSVMLSGPSGTGKTAIVKSWLEHNKDKVNGYFIDCAYFRKCSGNLREKNGLTLIGQVFTDEEIDNLLSLLNRVIVVDNFHLLSKEQQQHIALLADGYVVDGREANGFRKLDNLEFVCAIKTEL